MKKFFLKETGKELQFGDMIELDFTQEMPNGKTKYHHLECKFHPMLVPILLESGVIEEKESCGIDEIMEIAEEVTFRKLICDVKRLKKKVAKLERELKK